MRWLASLRPIAPCLVMSVFVSSFVPGCARRVQDSSADVATTICEADLPHDTIQSVTAEASNKEAPPALESEEVEIIALLQGMPNWMRFGLFSDEYVHAGERAEIEATMRRIASYDLDTIRQVIAYYYWVWDSHFAWEDEDVEIAYPLQDFDSKILLLNQFLFELPETVRRDSPHFQFFSGGWIGWPISGNSGDPQDSDEMDYRWPWSEDSSGAWRLTERFAGYKGSMYRGDVAFDYFRKEFGKRAIVTGVDTENEKHEEE